MMSHRRQHADDEPEPETFDETALGKPSSTSVAMRHGSDLRGALSPLVSEPRRSGFRASRGFAPGTSVLHGFAAASAGKSGMQASLWKSPQRSAAADAKLVASRRAPSQVAPGLKASQMSSASDGGGAARSRIGLVG